MALEIFETVADADVDLGIIQAHTQTRHVLLAHLDNLPVDIHERDALHVRMFCDLSYGAAVATTDYQHLSKQWLDITNYLILNAARYDECSLHSSIAVSIIVSLQ